MWNQPPGYRLPPQALATLGELELKMAHYSSAEKLWRKVFSETDRERLGGPFKAAFAQHGTFGMWIELRGGSPLRALIDSGHAIGYLSKVDHQWLLREIGESEDPAEDGGSLRWDRTTRELTLGSRIIRRVRSLRVAKDVAAILDAFEEAEWPRSIETPASIDTSLSSTPVHNVVRTLNRNLHAIRFHVDEGGSRVFWDRR
jgi:hypothetical protein